MKNHYIIIFIVGLIFLFLFSSCNKSDELQISTNTLKVTASSGTTEILNKYKLVVDEVGAWTCSITEPRLPQYFHVIILNGVTDLGSINIYLFIENPQKGVLYSHSTGNVTVPMVQLFNWIPSDYVNTTKTTLQFSEYQNPGRIVGEIVCYDKSNNIIAKSEFDFIYPKRNT